MNVGSARVGRVPSWWRAFYVFAACALWGGGAHAQTVSGSCRGMTCGSHRPPPHSKRLVRN